MYSDSHAIYTTKWTKRGVDVIFKRMGLLINCFSTGKISSRQINSWECDLTTWPVCFIKAAGRAMRGWEARQSMCCAKHPLMFQGSNGVHLPQILPILRLITLCKQPQADLFVMLLCGPSEGFIIRDKYYMFPKGESTAALKCRFAWPNFLPWRECEICLRQSVLTGRREGGI